MMAPDWIAADWGTSNLRIWGLSDADEVLFARESDQGMSKLGPADYPKVLTSLLGSEFGSDLGRIPVVVCGMAGARQGWREAAYLPVPARLDTLGSAAVSPDVPDARLRPYILPGLCQATPGQEDVMRGEETQILGLVAGDPGFTGTVCLPGTHSKWVRVEDGCVTGFETVMTGEIFALLSTQSVLRHAATGLGDGPHADDGLDAGLTEGLASPERLTSTLFRTRAASLLSGAGPDWCRGYLSGLLIGAEVAAHRSWRKDPVVLIGADRLCRIYGMAIARDSGESRVLDATKATLDGLAAARKTLPAN